MKTKLSFCVFTLAVLLFTACSKDEPDARPGVDNKKGQLTFAFPNVNGVTTYSQIASEKESWLNTDKMYIYVIGGKTGKEQVEMVFTGKDITSNATGSSVTATISIPEWLVNEEKTFYFMADMGGTASGAATSLGNGTLLNVLSKATTNELDDKTLLSSADGLLLTGKIKANLKTNRTTKTVTLKRRVARFDVSNNTASSKVIIKSISIGGANYSGYVFADNSPDLQSDAKKGDLQVIPFEGVKNANAGNAESVFYLYPAPRNSTSIYLLAVVDGVERLFSVPSPKNGIEANKRYTIISKVVNAEQMFEMKVDDWESGDEILPAEIARVTLVGVNAISGADVWDATTNTFHPSESGVLEVTVLSQYANGVNIRVDPILGDSAYSKGVIVEQTSGPVFSHMKGYTQTFRIEIPEYPESAPIGVKIRFTDNVSLAPSEALITINNDMHGGWAGSNIYWDGAKLTFSEDGTTAQEDYQGVYFKWGSLWGISSTVAWVADNSVFYESIAGNKVNKHKKSTKIEWEDIPYAKSDVLPSNRLLQYLTDVAHTEENVKKGIGDICKFLSPLHGKNWRMPTSFEFGESRFKHNYTVEENRFVEENNTAPSAHPEGSYIIPNRSGWNMSYGKNRTVYFPAAGYRGAANGVMHNVGLTGHYWSSSPRDPNGADMTFTKDDVFPYDSNNRGNAYPVRCVIDNGKP